MSMVVDHSNSAASARRKEGGAASSAKISVVTWRRGLLFSMVAAGVIGLVWRSADLQLMNQAFLQKQGDARHLRVATLPAHRGVISDRNGEPLAISTPVDSIWAVPGVVLEQGEKAIARLATTLDTDVLALKKHLERNRERQFLFLKRRLVPSHAKAVLALNIDGVHSQREYRRYYPAGEVAAHVVGFTNVDDQGQEALELAYNDWLEGHPGKKRVLKDGRGRPVKNVELIKAPVQGQNLALSIDKRIQFLAYRELKAAVIEHRARGGAVVVMDPWSGEVLAMVNQPSFNPNDRSQLQPERLRNKALVDAFEPGSTMKPFTVLSALESGQYAASTLIDTSPGLFRVGRHTISDHRDYGTIDVSTVIQKSSNVGVAKMALHLGAEKIAATLEAAGFGESTGSGFPGEASGQMRPYRDWRRLDLATLAFGYGLTVTPLQLARAYSILATGGVRNQVTLLRHQAGEPVEGRRVFTEATTRQVVKMMERVVQKGGTATRAALEHYRVAGKTGTAKKSISGGYADDNYVAVFAGMTPVEGHSLICVVMIDEPRGDVYYGGLVAAPVFKKVMTGTLRLLNIAPDKAAVHKAQSLPVEAGQAAVSQTTGEGSA